MTLCTEVWQGSAVHAAAPGPWRPHEAVLVTLVAGGLVAVVVQRAGAPVLAVLLPPVRPVAALGVVLAHRLHQSEGGTGSRDQLSANHSSPGSRPGSAGAPPPGSGCRARGHTADQWSHCTSATLSW